MSTEELANHVLESALNVIVSVDGITDINQIKEWLQQVPSGYLRVLTSVIDNASEWGPNLFVHRNCKNCNADIEIEIALNPISFFS